MNLRDDMMAALKKVVLPALRQRGYKGSFPHLRRIREDVDLLTFQFDQNGGGFVIEAAKGKKEGFTTYWGKFIPADKLCASDLHPDQRKRIQPGADGSTDSWFRYDGGEECETVAHAALSLILKEEEPNQSLVPTPGSIARGGGASQFGAAHL
jgi:hypothetical protein